MRPRRVAGLVSLLAAAASLAAGALFAPTAGAAPFETGLTDPVFESADAAERNLWLDRASQANASTLLMGAAWGGIAPSSPGPAFEATDPGDPAYNWGTLDASIRDAAAKGLEPMLLVTGAPLWAEGRNRPSQEKAPLGSWKPDPKALGEFGEAIARRYSGTYVNPADPGAGPLPRVRRFQLWAEPNLSVYLTPQYIGKKPFAPGHYRLMLRSFYEGVHKAVGSDLVVTGGTAPYGDPGRGGERTQPVRFWRELLCLKGSEKLKKTKCKAPAKFDVWAHNPINVGQPRRNAINRDDASTPDLARIGRVVNKAVKSGTALPRKRKPVYATELWWDSNPPDEKGIPEKKHARWLAEGFYVLWKQGAERVYWFQIRDPASSGDDAAVTQSGLYLRNGKPKLAERAFAFPFATDRAGKGPVQVWGVSPQSGKVAIERKVGKVWRRAGSARAKRDGVFTDRVRARQGDTFRARIGGDASVPFTVK